MKKLLIFAIMLIGISAFAQAQIFKKKKQQQETPNNFWGYIDQKPIQKSEIKSENHNNDSLLSSYTSPGGQGRQINGQTPDSNQSQQNSSEQKKSYYSHACKHSCTCRNSQPVTYVYGRPQVAVTYGGFYNPYLWNNFYGMNTYPVSRRNCKPATTTPANSNVYRGRRR